MSKPEQKVPQQKDDDFVVDDDQSQPNGGDFDQADPQQDDNVDQHMDGDDEEDDEDEDEDDVLDEVLDNVKSTKKTVKDVAKNQQVIINNQARIESKLDLLLQVHVPESFAIPTASLSQKSSKAKKSKAK